MALSTQQQTDIQKQYDPIRARLQRQEGANLQTQRDQLARNAARLGGGLSGAFVKQEQIANDASARRLQEANEGVDAQQQAALNQAREIQAQREFQTGERLGSQKFQSGESALQRQFLTGERLGSQKFQTGERLGSQKFAASEAYKQRAESARQFDDQMAFAAEQFKHEKVVDKFNMDLATKIFEKKDMLEQLFGNIGGGYQQFDKWVGGLPIGVGGGGVGGIGKKLGL